MKKVIFLCLLSLTLCLSQPAEPVPAPNSPPAVNGTSEQTSPAAPNKTQTTSTQTATETKPVTAPTTTPTGGQPAQNESKPNSTVVPTDNNTGKAAEPPKGSEGKETGTPATPNNTAEVKPTTNNETKGEDKKDDKQEDKKNTTTVAPAKSSSAPTEAAPKTETPAKADEDKHMVQARGFDGPSFMGGIILTLGLLAIGFMGFKYYKNQTERNYHTL